MSHVVKDTPRCVIDIDTDDGRIFFQQRWQYRWLPDTGRTAWTYVQKERFHQRADRMIWRIWSNRVHFTVGGGSDFARRFQGRAIPVNFDVRWVLSNPHWTVDVLKVPPGFMRHPTRVEWPARRIFLCTEDFETSRHAGGIVAHEFGHSMGNTGVLRRGDEYRPTSPHFADKQSVINVGSELRRRHFQTMIEEMATMIPGTTWQVGAPR